jgi:hypothetical protein
VEWTAKSIFKLGETYEQLGTALQKRERPKNLAYQKRVALEEGIASVVERYFVDNALKAHEQNVQFGIKNKYEDEWVNKSRRQLTRLPCMAGMNYSKLIKSMGVSVMRNQAQEKDPMKMLQRKLVMLQDVAPFQDNAIKLYLRTLEMAAKYSINDKYKKKASAEVTQASYEVGNTYAGVVDVARSAPIPPNYDPYKKFFYKVHLLEEGLVEYENNAIEALYKNIKIAEAYDINDEWVIKSKEKITEILFKKSMCYEILAEQALRKSPIPQEASEEEAEEYRLQFEELGYKVQDMAYQIYRDIYEKGKKNITHGRYLDLSYLRLYMLFPDEIGAKVERDTVKYIRTGREWRYSGVLTRGWMNDKFDDSAWKSVKKGSIPDSVQILGATETLVPVWGGDFKNGKFTFLSDIYLRRVFDLNSRPEKVMMQYAATGDYDIFINGVLLISDSLEKSLVWNHCRKRDDFSNMLRKGKNSLSIYVRNAPANAHGFFAALSYSDKIIVIMPKLPSQENPMTHNEVKALKINFPRIKNFKYPPEMYKW